MAEHIKHTPDEVEEFHARMQWKRDKIRAKMGEPTQQRVVRKGPIRDGGADPEGWVMDPDDAIAHAATLTMLKEIGAALDKHYPGFAWVVEPDDRGRVFNIFNHSFHDAYGCVLRYADINQAHRKTTATAWAIRLGGEILERFGYKGRYNPAQIAAMPRDSKGRCLPDLSDKTDRSSRKQAREARIAKGLADGSITVHTDSKGNRVARVITP